MSNLIAQKQARLMDPPKSSKAPAPEDGARAPKISRVDYAAFNQLFEEFTRRFQKEIDLYFKNYNRFIKEQRNKIEIQGKDDKKKRKLQFKILESQEISFWTDFPRKKKFYSTFLCKIRDLVSQKKRSSDEVRDVEQIISTALDFLPTCSKKYCARFSMTGTAMEIPRKVTFDNATHQLSMFDSDDNTNWHILANAVTILVSDLIAVALDPLTDAAPLQFGHHITNRILQQARLYMGLSNHQKENNAGSDEKDLIDIMHEQIQFIWSNQIFAYLSKSSKANFDACYKFVQQPLSNDHRKFSQAENDSFIQQIYFGRYLQIAPLDMDMATKVLYLLDTLLNVLISKVDDDFKKCLLSTLKYFIEQLEFCPCQQPQYDVQAMEILQERVTKIFSKAEKLCNKENSEIIKKEVIGQHCLLLMAQILKVSSDDFVDQQFKKFSELIKMSSIFQSSKRYSQELKLFVQLCVASPVQHSEFRAWKPKTHHFDFCLQEKDTSIYTPISLRHAPLNYIKLRRKQSPVNIADYFELIFSPKFCQGIEYAHWQILEQLAHDSLDFIVNTGLQHLLQFRSQEQSIEFLILGLKLARYLIEPSICFQQRYRELHPNADIDASIARVKDQVNVAVKEILEKKLNLSSDYAQSCINFYRLESLRQSCSDQPQALQFQLSDSLQSAELSKKIKAQVQSKFYLQDKARQVTLEDMKELQELDFKYQSSFLNQIESEINNNTDLWDKKREQFIRNRMQCHLAESPEGQRQNTTSYNPVQAQKSQPLEMVQLIARLLPYLELPEFMFVMPCRPLTDLTQRVAIITQIQPEFSNQNSFLQECEGLIPTYWLLSLDFGIQNQALKCLQKMMVYQPVQIKIAILDQVCYMIKEVMLRGPDDNKQTIMGLFMTLGSLVKTWLRSEMTRLQIQKLDRKQYFVLEIASSDPQALYSNLHIFQFIDMLSFMALCSQELKIRQIACLTQVEIAKLKRLIVHKERQQPLLNDLIYKHSEGIVTQNLSLKLTLMHGFKGYGYQERSHFEQILQNLSIYQILTDNFEYSKFGLNESLMRDIQVLFTGDLMRLWKQELLKLKIGPIMLNFMQKVAGFTLQVFENRTSDQSEQLDTSRDGMGFNLLLAVVIFNISKSHTRLLSDEQLSSEEVLSQVTTKNTIIEETKALVALCETNFNQMHKIPFGKLFPSRIWTSNVLFTYLYYLQDDAAGHPKSLENLQEIFLVKRINFDDNQDFGLNCVLFHTLLSQEEAFFNHVLRQVKVAQASPILYEFLHMLELLEKLDLPEDQKKQTILRVCLTRAIVSILRRLIKELPAVVSSEQYMPVKIQQQMMTETRALFAQVEKTKELSWLCPLIKEIWYCLLTFEKVQIFDLKFLIQMEQDGFAGSLNFFKSQSKQTQKMTSVQEQSKANDIKLLIQHVYAFYTMPLADTTQMLNQSFSPLIQQPSTQTQKNVFFACLLSLIDSAAIRQQLENKSVPFKEVQQSLSMSLINCKTDKLTKFGLVSKLFLVCLFITLNATDKKFIEQARVICLATLPLMFTDLKYKEIVEQQVRQANLQTLINFENRQFYQFIKRIFKDEETYNMQHHFEKYFSLSGFLRDLLNEMIKLQTTTEPQIDPRMMLKVLDMITYFFSGNLALRRSPVTDDGSFIFANLIDYKSFEFLSKLYKISERLVDHDTENMTVMNMWYKVCEGRESNFEVLAKFLVHNLSSQVLKLKQPKDVLDKTLASTEIEFEKHKRYSLSVFNYIKARTQQMDVRNSLNINSVTWSQKMLKIVLKAQLNLQSKYTLEKLKLKKVLEQLHAEINQSGLKLKLKGGLETLNEILRVGGDAPDMRMSVSMNQLLQSQTFLSTFRNEGSEKSTLKMLIFIIRRQMSERFDELTPEAQILQLPEIVIKYFENTLILIANESERLQIIKFSQHEEIIVAVLILVLTADHAINQDTNRAYFLYDLFNKLAVNVSGIQKYLRVTTMTIDQFCAISNEKDILELFNVRNTLEVFQKFTSVYFKVLQNLIAMPPLHSFMNSLWSIALIKNQESCYKENITTILFSRTQVLEMLQVSFFTLHQICLQSRRQEDKKTEVPIQLVRNFCKTFSLLVDYVQPNAKQQFFDFNESKDVAFATNTIYWFAFACMQSAFTSSLSQQLVFEIQTVGTCTMRRLFEESEFLKTLLNVQKLSPLFSTLKLPLDQDDHNSIIHLLFLALENPKCSEDAFRCLMVTIKAQDTDMISLLPGQDEMHRLLLLLPYLVQQFTGNSRSNAEVGVFNNKRSVVQLLKKSLPSISINTKKEVLEILDVIQREVDQNDRDIIEEQFKLLVNSIRARLGELEYGTKVIQSCRSTLKKMINNRIPCVDLQILKDILERISQNPGEGGCKRAKFVWPAECANEEVAHVLPALRSSYFGIKHIILKETEMLGKVQDCQMYFVNDSNPLIFQPNNLEQLRKKSFSSVSEPPKQSQRSFTNDGEQSSRNSKLKGLTKKQEMVSKYKNSTNQNSETKKQFTQFKLNNLEEELGSPDEFKQAHLKIFQDDSPEQTELFKLKSPTKDATKSPKQIDTFAESVQKDISKGFKTQQIAVSNDLIGTFAKQPLYRNEMQEFDISQQISSISIKPNDRSYDTSMVERPQTGAFSQLGNQEFEFQFDDVKVRGNTQQLTRQADDLSKHQPVVNKMVKSNSSVVSLDIRPKNKLDFLLNKIRSDDQMLYELETFLEGKYYDLDLLAFYIKVLEFKSDEANRMLAAGLIIDNYLGEEAEYYIGTALTGQIVREIEHKFEQVIVSSQSVLKVELFDEALKLVAKDLETLVKEFLNV